ncbi:MFS transporter [Amycolatopsis mongoliensis]|uniref:hypothetical protein n=1 Tax=Amycolatopsis mongoliensis TaxID=715475 RepID=UPI002FCD225A
MGVIAGSLPADRAGVGTGLQATTREFGSALGVAVIATVMTAEFDGALPLAARGAHTVAEALARSGNAHDVVTAFVASADAGLRVAGIAVLVLGVLVLAESKVSQGAGRSEGRLEGSRFPRDGRHRCNPDPTFDRAGLSGGIPFRRKGRHGRARRGSGDTTVTLDPGPPPGAPEEGHPGGVGFPRDGPLLARRALVTPQRRGGQGDVGGRSPHRPAAEGAW